MGTASRTTGAAAWFPGSRAALGKGARWAPTDRTPLRSAAPRSLSYPPLNPATPRCDRLGSRPSLRTRPGGAGSCSRTRPSAAVPKTGLHPAQAAETRLVSPSSPEPTPARPQARGLTFSQRPPDTRAARAPPRSASRRVSGRCRRTSAFRRVSGRRRRASASRLVSGGVGGPRPLRGSGGSSASGRRLGPPVPQEAAPPRPRREALSPGLPGFSLPPETHSSAPRQPRLKRRGRRQEEGRWGRVQTKELGRSALSAWGTALNHRGRRPPGWKAQPQSVSRARPLCGLRGQEGSGVLQEALGPAPSP